mmetsp:Transcript_90592/g.282093  ORF Transcript_90592/g.282093 Transcript_90592/m.282093 type:complete len:274 (+) Transcript_90592:419-1240(+)
MWHMRMLPSSTAPTLISTIASGASTLTSSHRARKAKTATAKRSGTATTRPTRTAALSRAGRRLASIAGYTTPTRSSAATTQAGQFDLCQTPRAWPRRHRPRSHSRVAPTKAGASSRRPTAPASGRPLARRWPSPSWTSTAGAGTRVCWRAGPQSHSCRRAGISRVPATCSRGCGTCSRHGMPGGRQSRRATLQCQKLACVGASSRWCTPRTCTSAPSPTRWARRSPRRSPGTRWRSWSSGATAGCGSASRRSRSSPARASPRPICWSTARPWV